MKKSVAGAGDGEKKAVVLTKKVPADGMIPRALGATCDFYHSVLANTKNCDCVPRDCHSNSLALAGSLQKRQGPGD